MTKDELKEQFSLECTELDTKGRTIVKGTPIDIINWIADKFCLPDFSNSVCDDNPYMLTGEELSRTEAFRKQGRF